MSRRAAGPMLLALVGGLLGCGGARGEAFSPLFPDNRDGDVDEVLGRLAAAQAPEELPVAVGVTAAPHRLFAVDLARGTTLFDLDLAGPPVSAPHVAGDYVVLHEARGVVVRRLRDGAETAVIEDEAMHLAGAGGEGRQAVLALTTGGGVSAQARLVLVDEGGVRWVRRVGYALGAPTVAGGMVFAPWATQNVSVLDARGPEIARVRFEDDVVGHAQRIGEEVFLGQRGLFRFDARIGGGRRDTTTHLEPTTRELPGTPSLLVDPYRPAPAPESAVHRVRLAWRPESRGEASMGLSDDSLYVVYYRMAFALDPATDAAHWAVVLPHDAVGVEAQRGGVFVADEDGTLRFLDARDGHERWSGQVPGGGEGTVPLAVRFRPGTFAPGGEESAAESTLTQLVNAARMSDARLVPARILAVHLLGELEGDAVSEALIGLCGDRSAPRQLRGEACDSLAGRRSGPGPVRAALATQASFLDGRDAPPVGPLAAAAAALGLGDVVPSLLAHLEDPATELADLPALVRALDTLDAEEAEDALSAFLRLYHAADPDAPMVEALGRAAESRAGVDAREAGELLEALLADPFTAPQTQDRLLPVAERIRAGAVETPAPELVPEDTDSQDDELPLHVTAAMVEAVLEPAYARLTECLRRSPETQARLVIVLEGDGTVFLVDVDPERFQSCIEPIVRRYTFPGNRRGAREQVRLTIRR
ncbi:MAG: PQQ-binding-like beta-propeller repeat protein [Myxococcota bacterium]